MHSGQRWGEAKGTKGTSETPLSILPFAWLIGIVVLLMIMLFIFTEYFPCPSQFSNLSQNTGGSQTHPQTQAVDFQSGYFFKVMKLIYVFKILKMLIFERQRRV